MRLPLLAALLTLAGCGDGRLEQLDLSGNALGTTFNVSIVAPPDALDIDALEGDIVATLTRIDLLASTWRGDSELSAFNENTSVDWILVSPAFCAALESTRDISEATNGAFDVTVGPLVNLWGFGPGGDVAAPPSDAEIDAARRRVGYGQLDIDCDARLVRKDHRAIYVDLSGWAKGHAVDALAALLDARGLGNYLVEIGGELRVSGHNSERRNWAIAIEAPSTSERVPHAIVRVTDTSVATSGDYRNYFEHDGARYSHTIDPRTGRPVTHDLAAVTVVHPSAAFADAMATAFLVLGPVNGPALATELDVAGYFLVRNGTNIEEIATLRFDTLDTQ
ncbi:MAG: FAD:protein FMN transferase [Gammaproteobacteria bacterium]|nr:FAD:protein FMN transferase [Gammaproteobacteria bacterium]NNF49885.1 FAD:protein FMN transferase [Woeseiaceae bacterium]MBT8093654.1 FAD:protein FMN transferase [Gammaproteobacteria bacterium]MBT8104501.1 FAD:protein FMN transferase [Gammaproteobacteria bacterium]NNK24515.1 FAD:protein FMN transferase [Woeseiaceae bacterium]